MGGKIYLLMSLKTVPVSVHVSVCPCVRVSVSVCVSVCLYVSLATNGHTTLVTNNRGWEDFVKIVSLSHQFLNWDVYFIE